MLVRCCSAALLLGCATLSSAQPALRNGSDGTQNQSAPDSTVRLVPRSAEDRDRASSDSHDIVLNVFVTDASGKPVSGLAESDFTILDKGQSQKITYVRPAQPPHVILLLDAVNSSPRSFTAERKAVEKYLAQSNTLLALPIAIGWLSGSRIVVSPESRDRATLLGQLHQAPDARPGVNPDRPPQQNLGGEGASSGSLLPADRRVQKVDLGWEDQNQRFVLSVNALTQFALREQKVPGRIFVIWLGAGWPLLTGPGFKPDSREVQTNFFDRIADLSSDLRDAQVTLNAVTSPDQLRDHRLSSDYYAPFLAAVTMPDQASAAHLALPILAVHSGGQVIDEKRDIASAIADCLTGIDSWYMLSFQSRPSSQPDEYRSLQVKAGRPELRVRTATGYYAQP
jgi:VWFA-related protein